MHQAETRTDFSLGGMESPHADGEKIQTAHICITSHHGGWGANIIFSRPPAGITLGQLKKKIGQELAKSGIHITAPCPSAQEKGLTGWILAGTEHRDPGLPGSINRTGDVPGLYENTCQVMARLQRELDTQDRLENWARHSHAASAAERPPTSPAVHR